MEGKKFMFDLQRFDDPVELTMKYGELYAGDTKVKIVETANFVSNEEKYKYICYELDSGNYIVNEDLKLNRSIIISNKVNIKVLSGKKITLDTEIKDEAKVVKEYSFLNGPLNVAYGGDLTVDGEGTISGTAASCGICVTIGPNNSPYNKTAENILAKLTVNGNLTIQGSGYGISGNGTRNGTEITINGGTIKATAMHSDSELTEKPQDASKGIYHPQDGTLTINGGNISGETGIEIRSGNLVIPENSTATITATANVYSVGRNGNGGTTAGAAIAISQHTTAQKIDADISGGTATGTVALSVANPEGNSTNDPEVEINGGTFESTDENTAAIAAQNADSRVSIKVKSGTFKGALASTFATTGTKAAAIEITGSVTVVTTVDGEEVTETYDSTSLQYKVSKDGEDAKYETVSEGWNKIQATGEFLYLQAKSGEIKEAEAYATLAPATENGTLSTTVLELKTADSGLTTLALDMTADLFKELEYKTIDASNGNKTVAFNITGNDNITSILGGGGNDTLTATSTNGVSLNGGAGADLLIGSSDATKADTFIFTAGSDSIQGYSTVDVVSLGSGITAPTTFDKVNYTGSDYVISLGSGTDSLTFTGKNAFTLTDGKDTYHYARTEIAKNDTEITLSSDHANKFNGTLTANENYETIDGSAVTGAIRIIGNGKNNYIIGGKGGGTLEGGSGNDTLWGGTGNDTLTGGDGADSLVGGTGNDVFVYTGGEDSISSYDLSQGDLVSVRGFKPADATFSVSGDNISLDFGGSDKLIFEGVGNTAISLKSGRTTYAYTKNYFATDDGITLAAGYGSNFDGTTADNAKYKTIDGSAVSKDDGISITGNDNSNYIVGSATKSNSLTGGKGNDTFRGGSAADVFFYTAGKDVIQNFGVADSLSIDSSDIAKVRTSSSRLTFTMNNKNNTLVLRSNGEIPEKILLADGDYLTKDGVVNDTAKSLNLFSSAKGRIEYGAGITSINASAAEKQSVTLVGGTEGGTFIFADKNKKRDGFEYNGGSVSISGYEAGKDRINLGDESIVGFSLVGNKDTGNDVLISLSSSDDKQFISLKGAKGSEVMIHQDGINRGNSYSKMVFAETGVVYDKAATKATSATIWAGGDGYSATGTKVKKITVKDSWVSGISLQAGDNNTLIDASAANGVSLYSGAKNDKLIGSKYADTFVYTKGKDILQDFNIGDGVDQISLNGGNNISLESAKITANKKSIKFKFGTKDVLTVKPTKGDTLSGELNINGTAYTYGKNSIADNDNVTLTSKFGGTYNISKSGGSTIDGGLVEKKLTFKGTSAAESLTGGTNKTTFKGGGGNDTLTGGSGADIFFYAKGDAGTATITNFDFTKDKLKIAGGTLSTIKKSDDGGVQFAMKNGRGESPEVGWFNLTGFTKDNVDANKVLIKANNTYYWFAQSEVPLADDSLQTAKIGDLITWDKKVSSSDVGKDAAVIELNYGTNLVRAGVAVAVSKDNKAGLPT